MNQLSLREIISKYDDESILNKKSLTTRKDEYNNTILHYAAIYNRVNLVIKLIEQYKMNPKEQNYDGLSPYLAASKNGNHQIIKYLIDNKLVDINETDFDGNNALIYAAYFDDNLNTIEYLISKNININHKNKLDKKAIDIAISNNSVLIIDILKSSAVNLNKYIVDNFNNIDENCIICLCKLSKEEKIVKLPCNHSYHNECLREWLKTDGVKEECLYCKKSI